MTRNRAATEDILQSIFIKIWQQGTVPSSEQEVTAWLFTVARNRALDFLRKCSRRSRLRLQYAREKGQYPEHRIENRTAWDLLGACSEEERSILYLHFRGGYSYKEIAAMYRNNENAIRVRAFRALAKLRKHLNKADI
jgi:RNA polymerase sigma-70 factor (ECF subfamily)